MNGTASKASDMDNLGAWEQYQRVAGLCEATITTRINALRRLQRDTGPLDQLTHHGLMVWLGNYAHPATRSTFLSYIRCFYRWALDEELFTTDPTRRVPRIKTPRRQPRPVSPEILRRTLAIAPPRERLWIELMAYAGLRVAEVAGCRPQHAQRHADGSWWLTIPRAKGGHAQAVALPSWLGERVALAEPWDIGPSTVTTRLGALLAEVGANAKPHAYRHFYGTTLLSVSGNLRIAQQGLRHADVSSTQIYTLVTNAELSEAVERLPRIA